MIRLDPLASLDGISHAFFTREGGASTGLYASRNVGLGSGDRRQDVVRNRSLCLADLGADALVTVHQVHSPEAVVVDAPWAPEDAPRADALVTDRPGLALGILTADCAPILFADRDARVIGAEIGRASCREECVGPCRSRWSPYNYKKKKEPT